MPRSSPETKSDGVLLSRMLSTTSSRHAKAVLSLDTPFTRRTLDSLRKALAESYAEDSEKYDPSERHAAVLVPLCNVNNQPGVLLEVRGKLRTHSGEVRCDQFLCGAMHTQCNLCLAFQAEK